MDYPPNYSDISSEHSVRLPSYNCSFGDERIGQIKKSEPKIAASRFDLITVELDQQNVELIKQRRNMETWNYQGSIVSGTVRFSPSTPMSVGHFCVQLVLYEVVDSGSTKLFAREPFNLDRRHVLDEFSVDKESFPAGDMFQGDYAFSFLLQFPHVLPGGAQRSSLLHLPVQCIPPPSLGSPHIFDEKGRDDIADKSVRIVYRLEVKAYRSKNVKSTDLPLCSSIKSLFYAAKYTADEIERYLVLQPTYTCKAPVSGTSSRFSKNIILGDAVLSMNKLPWLGVGSEAEANKAYMAPLSILFSPLGGSDARKVLPAVKSIDIRLVSYYISSGQIMKEIPAPEKVKQGQNLHMCTKETVLQHMENIPLNWTDSDTSNTAESPTQYAATVELPIVLPKNVNPTFFASISSCQHELLINVNFSGRKSVQLKVPVIIERV